MWRVKVSDFGCSKEAVDTLLRTRSGTGTPRYITPEVMDDDGQPYTTKVDIWSLGMVIYFMLTGTELGAYGRSQTHDYHLETFRSRQISNTGSELLQKMTRKDPKYRPVADHCLQDYWFDDVRQYSSGWDDQSRLPQQDQAAVPEYSEADIVEFLQNPVPDRFYVTPLQKAILYDDMGLMRELLEFGEVPQEVAALFGTVLHAVFARCSDEDFDSVRYADGLVVEYLEVDTVGGYFHAPLSEAILKALNISWTK